MTGPAWGRFYPPSKRDNGHSAVQYATGVSRSFVRCECGTILSGRGSDGGQDSHRKHKQRKTSR